MCKAPSRAVQRPFGGSAPTPTLIRWHSNPVTGNPQRRLDNPNPLEEEELVITDFIYAGKPWSSVADVAHITNFAFAAGTTKPWSDITNIPNTGAVNPIAGA